MEGRQPITLRELLDRPSRAAPPGPPATTGQERDEHEYVAYANGRVGIRPQLAVMFTKADGSVKAFAYSHLFGIESENPAVGFSVLFTGSKKVNVRGRNLQRLFQFLCEHRVVAVVEASRSDQLQTSPELPFVEAIEFGER